MQQFSVLTVLCSTWGLDLDCLIVIENGLSALLDMLPGTGES